MASEDRIDSVIDRAAVTKEVSETSAEIRELLALIQSVKGKGIEVSTAKSQAEFKTLSTQLEVLKKQTDSTTTSIISNTKAIQQSSAALKTEQGSLAANIELRKRLQNTLDSYKASQKDDLALLKTGAITRAEYNKRIVDSQLKIETYKVKVSELNRVIKEDIAIEGRAGDAYKQLSAEYNRAALAAKNYQITLGANNPVTIAAVKNAKQLSDQLKSVDNAVGQNTRNVGNYGGALIEYGKKAFGFIRIAANIIPGLGLSGAFLLIFQGIKEVINLFNNYESAADKVAKVQKAVNGAFAEANKEVGGQVENLKLLYDISQDTTQSLDDRVDATQRIIEIAKENNEVTGENIKLTTDQNGILNAQPELIDKISVSLIRMAKTKAFLNIIEKAYSDLIAAQNKSLGSQTTNVGDFLSFLDEQIFGGGGVSARQVRLKKKGVDDAQSYLTSLENQFKEGLKDGSLDLGGVFGKPNKSTGKQDKSAEAAAKLQIEAQKAVLDAQANIQKEIVQIESFSFDERIDALRKYILLKAEIINLDADYELKTAGKTQKEREAIDTKRNLALTDLRNHSIELLKINLKEEKKVEEEGAYDMEKISKDLNDKLIDDTNRYYENKYKKQKEQEKLDREAAEKRKDLEEELTKELIATTFAFLDARFEKEKNLIQDRIDLLDEQKAKDIETANQTIANTAQRADEIAIIEARAAAQKEQLQRRQRQLDIEKAKFDKAESIANIIQQTAVAILSVQKYGPPQSIILSALIGAIGAAQLARVIATPIPRYKHGTEGHKGGPMIVGDGGRAEGIVLPDGTILKTPSTDTLMTAPAGTKVYPDYSKMMLNATITKVPEFKVKTVSDSTASEVKSMKQAVVSAIKKIPQQQVVVENLISKHIRNGSSINNHITRNTN